jgi:alanine transaminase
MLRATSKKIFAKLPGPIYSSYTPYLTESTINPDLIKAEYAVRGTVPTRAAEIQRNITAKTGNYPFDSVTWCNIGNPQQFGQKYISFNRKVLDLVLNPHRIKSGVTTYHPDIVKRAQFYLNQMGGNIGTYTNPKGYKFTRESVARFINERDGIQDQTTYKRIVLSNGASSIISACLALPISDRNSGIMIPIPQYPLYSALITLYGGHQVPYYLDEDSGWQVDEKSMEENYKKAIESGVNPKAIVVINPGNPTGNILKKETIEKIIRFCNKNSLAIFADEVYQANIYKEGAQFVSFRKVLGEMEEPIRSTQELISFHSVSKGLLGECGLRGGYAEFMNFEKDIITKIANTMSFKSMANTPGQVMVDLMVNEPTLKDCSKEIVDQDKEEKLALLKSLKHRAKVVTEALNKMKNVSCQEVEGAMYAFPRLHLSEKAIEAAKQQGQAPDLFYCLKGTPSI